MDEIIRGYKSILYNSGRFENKESMHSAGGVLNTTGSGAEAYEKHYGLRLPFAREWFYVMFTGQDIDRERIQLPIPVVTYQKNIYGIRGINQLAEWGQMTDDKLVIIGTKQTEMINSDLVMERNSIKYYMDTGFLVAKDADCIEAPRG